MTLSFIEQYGADLLDFYLKLLGPDGYDDLGSYLYPSQALRPSIWLGNSEIRPKDIKMVEKSGIEFMIRFPKPGKAKSQGGVIHHCHKWQFLLRQWNPSKRCLEAVEAVQATLESQNDVDVYNRDAFEQPNGIWEPEIAWLIVPLDAPDTR